MPTGPASHDATPVAGQRRVSSRMTSELDSVTVDIIGHNLVAVAEEMGVAMMRAAYSPNIKERRDCTTALLDTSGHSIAQAEHIPIHMGSMIGFIPGVVAQYRGDINPGDIFISNDPY